MKFFGYYYRSEDRTPLPVELAHPQAVTQFIKDNLEVPQLVLTDSADRQLLLMREDVAILDH